MTFDELGLGPEVLRAVADAGYTTPTPIQAQAIPLILQGRDILASAQTGTGKTAAFTLPLIEILHTGRARARMSRSLILSPTRELAMQTAENFTIYGKFHKLTTALLIGGVSLDEQQRLLDRGVDVLIATPGRLLDHFERGAVLLNGVKILVIDEADRMLDMGFIPDIERIVGLLPQMRQTLMFSATMPPEIRRLAEKFLHNAREVHVSAHAAPAETVEHVVVRVRGDDKRGVLESLLKQPDVKNAIIFCNRKREADRLGRALKRDGISAAPLHGDMDQTSRIETLEAFKRGDIRFLVATDVAGRGIDIDAMSHVFNYDVPLHAEDYVHRIGRTGRAGMKGHAVTLAAREDNRYVDAIGRLIGKPLPIVTVPGFDAPEAAAEDEGSASGGRRGRGRGGRGKEAPSDRPARAPRQRRAEPRLREPEQEPAAPPNEPDEAPLAASEAEPAPPRAPRPPREPRRQPRDGQRDAQREPRHEKRREPRHGRDDAGDTPVVGLGDHVPAFLLRATTRRVE
jgi:superfamily II DNA/RNA helicase